MDARAAEEIRLRRRVGEEIRLRFDAQIIRIEHQRADERQRTARSWATVRVPEKADFATEGAVTVAPGVDYGEAVERGTGPGGAPSWATLADWIRVKRIVPRDITLDEADLIFLIVQKIHRQGTPAQPYMEPAADKTRGEVTRVIQAAVHDGLRAVGLL